MHCPLSVGFVAFVVAVAVGVVAVAVVFVAVVVVGAVCWCRVARVAARLAVALARGSPCIQGRRMFQVAFLIILRSSSA